MLVLFISEGQATILLLELHLLFQIEINFDHPTYMTKDKVPCHRTVMHYLVVLLRGHRI